MNKYLINLFFLRALAIVFGACLLSSSAFAMKRQLELEDERELAADKRDDKRHKVGLADTTMVPDEITYTKLFDILAGAVYFFVPTNVKVMPYPVGTLTEFQPGDRVIYYDSRMPPEIWIKILNNLETKYLFSVIPCVCKLFYHVASDGALSVVAKVVVDKRAKPVSNYVNLQLKGEDGSPKEIVTKDTVDNSAIVTLNQLLRGARVLILKDFTPELVEYILRAIPPYLAEWVNEIQLDIHAPAGFIALLAKFKNLQILVFLGRVENVDLANLSKLRKLNRVYIDKARDLSDDKVEYFRNLVALKLINPAIGDEGLKTIALQNSALEELEFGGALLLSKDALGYVSFPKLQSLAISNLNISTDAFANFVKHSTCLEKLSLGCNLKLSSETFLNASSNLNNLTSISCLDSDFVKDDMFASFGACTNLVKLEVNATNVTGKCLANLNLVGLKFFSFKQCKDLKDCERPADDYLVKLANNHPGLLHLDIEGAINFNSGHLGKLNLPQLEFLNIKGVKLSESIVQQLAHFSNLKALCCDPDNLSNDCKQALSEKYGAICSVSKFFERLIIPPPTEPKKERTNCGARLRLFGYNDDDPLDL